MTISTGPCSIAMLNHQKDEKHEDHEVMTGVVIDYDAILRRSNCDGE